MSKLTEKLEKISCEREMIFSQQNELQVEIDQLNYEKNNISDQRQKITEEKKQVINQLEMINGDGNDKFNPNNLKQKEIDWGKWVGGALKIFGFVLLTAAATPLKGGSSVRVSARK